MSPRFMISLPKEASGKDFRVIAEDGGYADSMADLGKTLANSYQATFEIIAQRDFSKVILRITANRETFALNGAEIRFDGAIGEILRPDGGPTGNFCEVSLGIDPSITQTGQTVGVLRMKPIASLPKAI